MDGKSVSKEKSPVQELVRPEPSLSWLKRKKRGARGARDTKETKGTRTGEEGRVGEEANGKMSRGEGREEWGNSSMI